MNKSFHPTLYWAHISVYSLWGFKSIYRGKRELYISVTDSMIVWDLTVKLAPTSWSMSNVIKGIWLFSRHLGMLLSAKVISIIQRKCVHYYLTHWGWDKIPPFCRPIFKCIFVNENVWISLQISPKFVPKVRNNNISAYVQIMHWHWPGDKPSSEPMSISLPTHTCVIRPQWVDWHTVTGNSSMKIT